MLRSNQWFNYLWLPLSLILWTSLVYLFTFASFLCVTSYYIITLPNARFHGFCPVCLCLSIRYVSFKENGSVFLKDFLIRDQWHKILYLFVGKKLSGKTVFFNGKFMEISRKIIAVNLCEPCRIMLSLFY